MISLTCTAPAGPSPLTQNTLQALGVLERLRFPRTYVERTLALLAGGGAALVLPSALRAGRAARLALAPPAWGREWLSADAPSRVTVAGAVLAPAAACTLWVRPLAAHLGLPLCISTVAFIVCPRLVDGDSALGLPA